MVILAYLLTEIKDGSNNISSKATPPYAKIKENIINLSLFIGTIAPSEK